MKNLLCSLPLLLTATAIALFLGACAFGLRLSPDGLALGAGLLTCLGLTAMSACDSRRTNYC